MAISVALKSRIQFCISPPYHMGMLDNWEKAGDSGDNQAWRAVMGFLTSAFSLFVLVTGVMAMWQTSFWLGLCGLVAPLASMIAGGVISETFARRETVRWGSSALAVVLLAGMSYWAWSADWNLNVAGYNIPGMVELAVGFFLGLLEGLFSGRRADKPS
ncbi:hypothetical protein [Parerythrobacter lacustris]|uniref:SPW repeat-containing protein n=1 Tax=Parerythrobacter lacustris TaxID=2969984 RepID=A0ABT1XS09_9SPHN|nr:hypothetical protein [Parerythrobacter lacustris]MCR2833460.1 hypothetical protein [Parerythrobacter lacustris]